MNQEFKEVFLNKYGYYELKEKPNVEDRKKVFEQEYFQNSMSSYEQEYTEQEKIYFENKLIQKELIIARNSCEKLKEKKSILDIGCGEGFALAYFRKQGYDVMGIDFSIYGVKQHNPAVVDCVIQGDSEEILPLLAEQEKKFDIINMDSVLDMMVNPDKVLDLCKPLLKKGGILFIKVANNYSVLQKYLLEKNKLRDTYWLDNPGHPSYFNRNGLLNLLKAHGYRNVDFYGESFIDFNLLNDNTNYYEDKNVGKSCYWAKIELENLMHELDVEKALNVYKLLGEMGLGREIIGVFMAEVVE